MTAISLNPNNPFRTPQLTPQNTSTNSVHSSTTNSATASSASTSQSVDSHATPESSASLLEALTEEAPPAYTLTADPVQGEATVEFGPRRPFQQAPPPILVPDVTVSSSVPSVNVHPSGISESSTTTTGQPRFAPPPRHPSRASSNVNLSLPSTSRIPPPRHPSQPQLREHARTQSAYLPPPSPPQPAPRAQSYSPPPGPPPPRRAADVPARRVSVTGSGTSVTPDDGRPTTSPTPGHPLLKDGKLLVYPGGHECSKCHNTGYKNYDPSQPCRKCWDKYARPYTGVLAYAPFPSQSSPTSPTSSSNPNGNFQRPLPSFRPPHASGPTPRPHSTAGYPGATQQRLRKPAPQQQPSSYQPPPGPPIRPNLAPQQPHYAPPQPPLPSFPTPSLSYPYSPSSFAFPTPQPSTAPNFVTTSPYNVAPPGAAVVHAGDPRIGGRLCWRCDGRGSVSFLFFDYETCGVCNGVGRVFN